MLGFPGDDVQGQKRLARDIPRELLEEVFELAGRALLFVIVLGLELIDFAYAEQPLQDRFSKKPIERHVPRVINERG
jgi:hypothetical protein